MFLSAVFEPFVEHRPVCVMARAVLERLLDRDRLDGLFERVAEVQYTEQLLFSTMAQLMGEVVLGLQPSVHASFQAQGRERIGASLSSVYEKLAGIETVVSEALVRDSFREAEPVVRRLRASEPSWLPGYEIRVVDGNHLSATEHRIEELRGTWAAPLPGKALVVYDQSKRLVRDVFLTEDGHAQERSLFDRLLATVRPRELWIADRNFCTLGVISAMAGAGAFFVLRQHGTVKGRLEGRRRRVGRGETGTVYEQRILLDDPRGGESVLRRITVELIEPTRDGDTEVHVLTNLPVAEADALAVADLYRRRWTVETVFFDIQRTLTPEIPSLGYPKAALFGLCLALLAYNAVSLIESAVAREHGRARVREEVSSYYLSLEIQQAWDGMQVAIPTPHWQALAEQSVEEFADTLRRLAARMDLRRYRKHKRGPKKPPPPMDRYRNGGHVSTARLIADRPP